MPTGDIINPVDVPQIDNVQQHIQIKVCSACLHPLAQDAPAFLDDDSAQLLCGSCKEQRLREARLRREREAGHIGHDTEMVNGDDEDLMEGVQHHHHEHQPEDASANMVLDAIAVPPFGAPQSSQPAAPAAPRSPSPPAVYWRADSPTAILSPSVSPISPTTSASQAHSPISSALVYPTYAEPNPYVDITRLRVRSHGQDCLFPGSTFRGTQKSGRSSYNVTVTVVDVDFSTSFLCGYLRIRGLTEDWPELTTYFDAEIIGSRYGFLTSEWGATEHEDMTHWARFPAFRSLKPELRKPHYTMKDRERDVVFMRWKERFLVPDHKVKEINGASFAGFYYVCVEFNPQARSGHPDVDTQVSPTIPASPLPGSDAAGVTHRPGVASMSGFYFHQNSEPYQQLTLSHDPETARATSSFEFR